MNTRLVRSFLDPIVSSISDPPPINFRQLDERGVSPVRAACRKAPNVLHKFKVPLNRNAFLCGCLDFTEKEPIEHVIVGIGFRHGGTTKVTHIGHARGNENTVGISESLWLAVLDHVTSDHLSEAVIFHNHPHNFVNVLADNVPIASGKDRRTLLAANSRPKVAIKSLFGGGRMRFYLGENGFVREFWTPNVIELLEKLARFNKRQAEFGSLTM